MKTTKLDTQFEKIKLLFQSQDYKMCEKSCVQYIQQHRYNIPCWKILAECLEHQGNILDAIEIYQHILVFDPMAIALQSKIKSLLNSEKKSKPPKINFRKMLNLPNVTVAVGIIVKNEEEKIQRCIDSVIGAVDEIVVIDTGSNDDTIKKIEQYPEVKLIEHQWKDNFAEARNAGLKYMESDWVFWIDADEYLDANDKDRDILRLVAGYFENVKPNPKIKALIYNQIGNSYSPTYDVVRMFSLRDKLHFTGRIHEQVRTKEEDKDYNIPVFNSGIRLYHDGYQQEIVNSKRKLERNVALLKLMINEEPHNPTWWSFLGRETRSLNKLDEALSYLLKAEELFRNSPSRFGRALETYDNINYIYYIKKNYDSMIETCEKMLQIDGNYPNAHYYLGLAKLIKLTGLLNESMESFNNAKQAFDKYRGNVSADENILHWRADLGRADVYRFSGKLSQALNIYRNIYGKGIAKEVVKKQIDSIEEQRDLLVGMYNSLEEKHN